MDRTDQSASEQPGKRISVVTPTLRRPHDVAGLLENLGKQTVLPYELILVDGAPHDETETQAVVASMRAGLPYACNYFRHAKGTAIQRNAGIEVATGDFIAFIDDDIRLDPDFFQRMLDAFSLDAEGSVGGVVGYRVNEHFTARTAQRWRWYRRLRLLSTFDPGRYDWASGYPINALMQPAFSGVRIVDFMTTSCAVWRRKVMDDGLRFDEFFRDFGVLEDAHFSLSAGKRWTLWQCGDARCIHDHSPHGRVNRRRIGYKCVVNYYFVFRTIAGPLSMKQKRRFWTFQIFELLRVGSSAIRRRRWSDISEVIGRLGGFVSVAFGAARPRRILRRPEAVCEKAEVSRA